MKTVVKAPSNPRAVIEGEQWAVILTRAHAYGITLQLIESHRTAERAAKGAAWLNKHASEVSKQTADSYTAIHMENLEVVK